MNALFTHAATSMAARKVPFSAVLPSLLYEQDRACPAFLRFKEARPVGLRKNYWQQLRTDSFYELARCIV